MRRLTHQHPHIADAFWRETLIDAAIFREWIVNLGSRDAYSRNRALPYPCVPCSGFSRSSLITDLPGRGMAGKMEESACRASHTLPNPDFWEDTALKTSA